MLIFSLESPMFVEFRGKIKIWSTYILLCQKIATFLTHNNDVPYLLTYLLTSAQQGIRYISIVF